MGTLIISIGRRLVLKLKRITRNIILVHSFLRNKCRTASPSRYPCPTTGWYYANSVGYPSESVCQLHSGMSGSPVALRAGAHTWQMIVASCPTTLGALCGQLTFRLAWCREHSAVTAAELLQPLDLACGTLFRSSCAIQTSPVADCSDDSWRDTFFWKHKRGALWLLICGALEKHLLTYLHLCRSRHRVREAIFPTASRDRWSGDCYYSCFMTWRAYWSVAWSLRWSVHRTTSATCLGCAISDVTDGRTRCLGSGHVVKCPPVSVTCVVSSSARHNLTAVSPRSFRT